jgi:hypothetical protein
MLNKLYGTLIFFFYFIKYPVALFLPIAYTVLEYDNNWIMNILWIICVLLILKDFMFKGKK